jgi:lipoprotein-releasing system permease protein
MWNRFELMIALRYLRPKQSNRFISVISSFSLLGIMLGVAALIVVMAVMHGYRQELMRLTLGFSGEIAIYGNSTRGIGDIDTYLNTLKEIQGVTKAVPIIERHVMATANGGAVGVQLRGIRYHDLLERPILADRIVAGGMQEFYGYDTVLVGDQLAASLYLKVGDIISLISPEGVATVMGSIPRIKDYRITGIFSTGMHLFDSSTVLMPLEAAQQLFRLGNHVTQIELDTVTPEHSAQFTPAIASAMGHGFRILDWQQANANILHALKIERAVMFMILTLIIVVAAFNIISSLIMLVHDKQRAIAILRTMGASRGSIMRIFFLCGSTVGVMGTILGVLLGVGFATHIEEIRQMLQTLSGVTLFDPIIYYFEHLPAIVKFNDVARVTLLALGLSCLATIYPAWKAARLDPAEAIRYE